MSTLLCLFNVTHVLAATCTTSNYSEAFASPATNENSVSSVMNWSAGGPIMPTHKQGAFPLSTTNPARHTLSERLVAADANAMFLMPGRRNALVGLTTNQGCQLVAYGFVDGTSWNNGPDLDVGSRLVIDSQASCGQAPMVLTGDVAGDGNMDIVTLSPTNIRTTGEIDQAYLYVRRSGSAAFTRYDISAPLQAANVSVHGGTPAVLGDVDGDGTADLIVGSSHGQSSKIIVFYANDRGATPGFGNGSVLVADTTLLTPFADAGSPFTTGPFCQGYNTMISRGITAVSYGDVNGDLLPDIVIASQSEYGLRLFLNLGRGRFQLQPRIPGYPDTSRLFLQDMDGDGDKDVVAIRSGRGCDWDWGRSWIAFNDGQNGFDTDPNGNPGSYLALVDSSIDWGGLISMPLSFPDGTQTTGGAPSILMGKASGKSVVGNYYNLPATSLYVTQALAVVKPITSIGSGATTLVQVQVDNISQTLPNAGSVSVDVSADSGRHWESLKDYELNGSQPHVFTHFGQELRWRAILKSPPTALPSAQAGYLLASSNPTKLSRIAFRYTQSTPSNYTRSQPAYLPISIGGKVTDHVLQASFEFPGFIGHLQAQNLSAYTVGNANNLQTLSPTTTWDAATKLRNQAASSRNIYSLAPQGNINVGNMTSVSGTRIPFTAAEFASGSTTPSLASLTDMDPARGGQYINQLRDTCANTDGYKLRDPGHSSPVAVLPPADDAAYLGNGYDAYAKAQRGRVPTVLLGANDGMLHAFDATTGNESWAYVPFNLLSKMQTQLATSGGSIVYRHDAFVDGPVAVADIYSQNQWRTVAVVGQAEGSTVAGTNYYHALDVTDPSKCIPLWEMSEGLVESVRLCNPDPCLNYTCYSNCSYLGCIDQDDTSNSQMALSSKNRDAGFIFGMLEAEHFDVTLAAKALLLPASFSVLDASSSSRATQASNGQFVQAQGGLLGGCTATTFPDLLGCASLGYRVSVDFDAVGSYVPAFSIWNATGATRLTVVIDDAVVFSGQPSFASSGGGWQWASVPAQYLARGDHTLQIYMRDPGIAIDRVVLTQRAGGPSGASTETSALMCQLNCSANGCRQYCLSNPASTEWPTCGAGNNQKCCPANGTGYCTDVANACGQPASRMGQGFSPPAIGRIRTSKGDRFVAFFASGYNSFAVNINVGRSIYMVDAFKGTPMATWNLPAVSTLNGNPPIATAVPGGVSLVDADNDGYVDRLYVGDLSGRLWKLNTNQVAPLDGSGVMTNPAAYATCTVFDAGVQGGSSRSWAPIITKPAVALLTGTTPNVYFGTGGDNAAPVTVPYSFYSVRDSDGMSACTQASRTSGSLLASQLEWQVTEPAGSGRFWADPTVVDGTSVVFSSYIGSPDSVNPCVFSNQGSHIYGMAAKPFVDASGQTHATGTSVWSNRSAFLTATGIVRTAASVRGQTLVSQVTRPQTIASAAPRDLLFQQFTGELLRVSSPGVQGPTKRLRVISIREIPR